MLYFCSFETSRRSVVRALSVAVLVASAGHVASASAEQDEGRAQELFVAGQRLLKEHKYEEACARLAESQALDPALGTLLNLALCHEKADKIASAWREYSAAVELARGQGAPGAARQKFAEQRASALVSAVPKLRVQLSGSLSGVVVTLDTRELQPAELEQDILLDPGTYVLEVSRPDDGVLAKYSAVMAPSRTTVIQIPIVEPRSPATPSARAQIQPRLPPANPHHSSVASVAPASTRVLAYGLGAAGLVGIAVGAGFLVHAQELDGDSKASAKTWTVDRDPQLKTASLHQWDSARTSQRLGLIAGAVGSFALGTSIVLFVGSLDHSAPERSSAFAFQPLVGGGSVDWSGPF